MDHFPRLILFRGLAAALFLFRRLGRPEDERERLLH
jgi:hypothetical protein